MSLPPFARSRRFALALLVAPWSAVAQTEISQAERTWRRLRRAPGHFDGAAWNDEVDRWQDAKHLAMLQLAQHARDNRINDVQLNRLMGAPDARWALGQPAHADALQRAQWQDGAAAHAIATTLLVYNWRARRDRLLLAVQDSRVVATGWLHDFE